MKQVFGLLLLSVGLSIGAIAQNTERIKVMTYNLLNYRNTTSWCDGTNNSSSQKDSHLETIVGHVAPHILVCQEVGASGVPTDRLLTNALNTNGTSYWAKAAYTNNSFSNIVNAAFYDTRYIGLKSQDFITVDANNQNLVRAIDFYRFYYKDSLLADDPDTVFFTVVSAHFKAGSTSSDEAQRSAAALATMQHIQNNVQDDNVILVGDLNVNSGFSTAFQHLVDYSVVGVRLYDPINEVGNWYNDYGSRYIHTQSTRLSNTNNGCFSGGGMDDRYDHILISDEILNGAEGIEYVTNSFIVLGNDGLHFNDDITTGVNLSVPANVLSALHGMSDHLPVIAEIDVEKKSIGQTEQSLESHHIRIAQINSSTIQIEWPHNLGDMSELRIIDLTGQVVYRTEPTNSRVNVDVSSFQHGMYLAQLTAPNGNAVVTKFIILP